MNVRQTQIFGWLKQVEPGLAELYEGSVKIIEDKTFPGRERFVCHAIREIRNRLPEAVAGESSVKQLDYPKEIEGLSKSCEQAGLGQIRSRDGEENISEYRIPLEIMTRITNLISQHRAVSGRKQGNAEKLFIALEPDNEKFREGLIPVVKTWLKETEWFMEGTHVGREAKEDDLISHFNSFEAILQSLVGYFYEGLSGIEDFVKKTNESGGKPTDEEVRGVIGKLGRPRYRILFFEKLNNPHWIEPLKKRGYFKPPADPDEKGSYFYWQEGRYLKNIATKAHEAVLDVLAGIKSRNPSVKEGILECLLVMPEDTSAKGVTIVKGLLVNREYLGGGGWFGCGEKAAKLMVKLLVKHRKDAFKIARLLIDVWRPGEKEAGVFETIRSKFATYEYKELIFSYYNKVWEKRPFESIHLLVDIYDKYLDECFKEKKYDVSEYLGVSLRDLEDIQRLDRDLDAIIMKAICEAGRKVIEKEPQKISELLSDLEKRNKGIFHRVEMYLLRFVPAGTEKNRINKIIGNQKFIESPLYKYEHRHLLNDKFDDVSDEAKKVFLEWVDKNKYYDEEHRKEITEWCKKNNKPLPDFEKLENRAKAEELYLVREKFKNLYEGYKKEAGIEEDSSLAPRKSVSEARCVSPEEGSPYSSEKMGMDSVENVLKYILEPKNYEETEKVNRFWAAKSSLAASFGTDVRKRPEEYLKVDLKVLERLDPEFLGKFFHAVSEAVRNGSFKKESWGRLIDLANEIVEANKEIKEWRECFLAILWVLNDGFGDEDNRIKFNETIIKKLWLIFKELVRYKHDEKLESEEDPIQRRLRSVQGNTFGQIIMLGIDCKNNAEETFDNFLNKEMVQVYTFVAKEVKKSEVNCTLGYRFANIYWLNKEWVESNLENIFCEEMWDAVWGSYVSWGRPSPQSIRYLVEKGIYSKAVEKIGKENKYKFGKEPDEGLVEHLIIGYFNGWINYGSDVLQQFFKKASSELRGKAAMFMTTGFKPTIEGKDEKYRKEVEERMRAYWKGRLAAIKGNPTENEKEAIAFTGWVEDSVLPAKETLELLEQTLNMSGGRIGEMKDAREFVEGISKLGKGNELLALQCLKKAVVDKNMHSPWAMIQEPLVKFLEELPESARSEGREVADLYGRYNPDKFRGVWEKLNN